MSINTNPLTNAENVRQQTEQLLGDAADETIRLYIEHLQNFADENSEDTFHLISTAQRHAFTKTFAFETAFRNFVGLTNENAQEKQKEYISEETH